MKDLKKEYEQLTVDSMPDLWDRIEAGVDAIEQEKKNETITPVVSKTTPNKKATIYKLNRIIPIVASAAVFVFGVGIFLLAGAGITRVMLPAAKGNATAEAPMSSEAASTSETIYEDAAEACEAEADYPYEEETGEAEVDYSYEKDADEALMADATATETTVEIATEDLEEVMLFDFTGVLKPCEDSSFVEATMEDGYTFLLYVPEEFAERIAQAVAEEKEITVEYSLVDFAVQASFPSEYEEAYFGITAICAD